MWISYFARHLAAWQTEDASSSASSIPFGSIKVRKRTSKEIRALKRLKLSFITSQIFSPPPDRVSSRWPVSMSGGMKRIGTNLLGWSHSSLQRDSPISLEFILTQILSDVVCDSHNKSP